MLKCPSSVCYIHRYVPRCESSAWGWDHEEVIGGIRAVVQLHYWSSRSTKKTSTLSRADLPLDFVTIPSTKVKPIGSFVWLWHRRDDKDWPTYLLDHSGWMCFRCGVILGQQQQQQQQTRRRRRQLELKSVISYLYCWDQDSFSVCFSDPFFFLSSFNHQCCVNFTTQSSVSSQLHLLCKPTFCPRIEEIVAKFLRSYYITNVTIEPGHVVGSYGHGLQHVGRIHTLFKRQTN